VSEPLAIAIAAVLLALNAFFVGAEFALVSARRSAIEPRAEQGSRAARTTLRAMERISLMLAGAQLGITICSLGLGYLGEPAIAHLLEQPFAAIGMPEALLHPLAFAVALGLIGMLHVVLGEVVPKNIALAGPDRAALALGPPLVLLVRLARPAIAALNAAANLLLRLAGIVPKDEVTSAFTRDEVAGLVEESRREGLLHPSEGQVLSEALTFEERTAERVLLPRDRVRTISQDATPEQVERLATGTGFSRFPVTGSGGRLVGYLHLKDALETEQVHRTRPIARRWIRPLPTVAIDDPLHTVLSTMQRTGAHLASALDGDGRALGIVTLEDVLEELVGEVRDETQRPAVAPGVRPRG
jgi:CBS domain containing-hemolysin-like protein